MIEVADSLWALDSSSDAPATNDLRDPDDLEVGDPASPSDIDGDGRIDALESYLLDRDGDDFPDELDAVVLDGLQQDRDGDGLRNAVDPDDDNDGICDPMVDPSSTPACGLYNGESDSCPYAPEAPASTGAGSVRAQASAVP